MQRKTLVLGALGAALVLPSSAFADGAVRVLHASPNAPAVDVYVDGARAVAKLKPGKITGYLSVPAGSHTWALRVAGAKASAAPVAKGSIVVVDGKAVTVAATGFLKSFKVRVIRDLAARPFGAAKIRVVHLSPDAPRVDVVERKLGKVVAKLRYGASSGYLTLPAGTYEFHVRPAGSKTAVIKLPGVKVAAGNIYTAWALGSVKGHKGVLRLRGAVTLDRLPTSFDRTRVRVLPGAPNVDVYLNGAATPLIANLAFGADFPGAGAYATLPSGDATLAVRPAGSSAAPVYSLTATLPAQATVTLVARGILGNGVTPFGIVPFVDAVIPLAAGKARVAAVHLSPTAPAVDIFAGGAKVIAGLAYGTASAALDVPAGPYSFAVKPKDIDTTVATVPATLAAGTNTVVYAIGLLGSTPALQFIALQAPVTP